MNDVVIGCVIDGTMAGLTSYGEFICLSLMDVGRLKHIVYDERWLGNDEHIKENGCSNCLGQAIKLQPYREILTFMTQHLLLLVKTLSSI